jgi:hypothetical protein
MNEGIGDLGRVLFRNDEEALASLRSALNDWLPFYQQHAKALGVDLAWLKKTWVDGADPWEILLDIGQLHQWVFEVDWRESYEDIVAGIQELKPATDLQVNWEQLADIDPESELNSFMQALGSALQLQGEILVILDKESDSFPFTLIQEQDLVEVQRLSEEVRPNGFVIVRETNFT